MRGKWSEPIGSLQAGDGEGGWVRSEREKKSALFRTSWRMAVKKSARPGECQETKAKQGRTVIRKGG
jgi:hypothetical protein